MKKVIFEAIAGYLNSVLNTTAMKAEYGEVMYIAPFNDQFNNEDQEHAIPKPAIAIGFPSSDGWETKTNNQQQGQLLISIYVVFHTIADGNYFASAEEKAKAMKRFDYLQEIQNALQGMNLGAAGTLHRTNEYEDTNHDHVSVDRIDYLTTVEDCLADPSNNYIEITPDWKIVYKNPTDDPGVNTNDYSYNLHNKV